MEKNNFKKLNVCPMNQTIPLLDIYPREVENIYSQKALYKNVHNSFIHISPKLQTAQVSINRRMISCGIVMH